MNNKLNPKNVQLGKSKLDSNIDFPNFSIKLKKPVNKVKVVDLKNKKDTSTELF